MNQSVVTIRLNGHPYQIGCGAGEEDQVAELGKEVESIMQSLVQSVGQIGEARLLAMVALILADRAASPAIDKVNVEGDTTSNGVALDRRADDNEAAELLEHAAERIAALASKLASGSISS